MTAGLVLVLALPVSGAKLELPRIDGKEAVASINGEPITLDDYLRALEEIHAGTSDAGEVAPKRDPAELVDRLVDRRLVLQEAKSMGLAESPEFQTMVQAAARDNLRALVLDRATRDVPPPHPGEVEALYRQKALEFQVVSVAFRTREDAARFVDEIREAPDFLETAENWIDDGKALSVEEPTFLNRSEMLPNVARELDPLEVGRVTPPISAAEGFAVVKLMGRRVPEDPAAREATRQEAWRARRAAAQRDHVDALRARRVKVDAALLEGIDLDADPKRLLQDERVLASILGGDPIRVRDLAAALQQRVVPGIERARQRGRFDEAKGKTLEDLATEAAIQAEGKDLGLDRTPELETKMRSVREGSLVGLFVRIVDSSVEVSDQEVRAFYEEHVSDFTFPETLRVESVAFTNAAAAERSLARLRGGADLAWLRAHAADRADLDAIPESLRFDGRILTRDSLPPEVRKSLEGAASGDFRLHVEESGRAHVLAVRDPLPARPKPLAEVRAEVARKLLDEKRDRAMDAWTTKLREASEVAIFATPEELREIAARKAQTPSPAAR